MTIDRVLKFTNIFWALSFVKELIDCHVPQFRKMLEKVSIKKRTWLLETRLVTLFPS